MTVKKREGIKQFDETSGLIFMVCGRVSENAARSIVMVNDWTPYSKGPGRSFRHVEIHHSKTRTLFIVHCGLDI